MLKALCNLPLFNRWMLTKTQLIMNFRATAVILLSTCLMAAASGFSQKVTLSESNAALEKVFDEIKRQTGFTFLYKTKLLNTAKPLSIEVTDETLGQVLELCFKDQPLTYKIFQKIIAV